MVQHIFLLAAWWQLHDGCQARWPGLPYAESRLEAINCQDRMQAQHWKERQCTSLDLQCGLQAMLSTEQLQQEAAVLSRLSSVQR